MSVLGLNSGYTVKYNPLPSGVPSASPWGTPSGKGLYLTVYPLSRPNTDTVQCSRAQWQFNSLQTTPTSPVPSTSLTGFKCFYSSSTWNRTLHRKALLRGKDPEQESHRNIMKLCEMGHNTEPTLKLPATCLYLGCTLKLSGIGHLKRNKFGSIRVNKMYFNFWNGRLRKNYTNTS